MSSPGRPGATGHEPPPGPELRVLEEDEDVPPRAEEEAAAATRGDTAPETPAPGAEPAGPPDPHAV